MRYPLYIAFKGKLLRVRHYLGSPRDLPVFCLFQCVDGKERGYYLHNDPKYPIGSWLYIEGVLYHTHEENMRDLVVTQIRPLDALERIELLEKNL